MSKKFDIKTIDPEPVKIKAPGYFHLICCGCGMRHFVAVEQRGKNVYIGFGVDEYGTMLIRRDRKRKKRSKK